MSSGTQAEQPSQSYVGAVVDSVSSGASYTYDTVASTASYTYTQAANLAASVTGSSASATNADNGSIPDSPAKEKQTSSAESALPQHLQQEEQQCSPSSSDRVGKSQQEIGTEYNIPTAAGLGSTVCRDEDSMPAAEKEASQRRAKPAAVGQDYASQPCPNSDGSAQKKSEDAVDTGAHEDHGDKTADTASQGGLGSKLKNKVKGEAKLVMGKIQKDEDKVQLGKSIKTGTA